MQHLGRSGSPRKDRIFPSSPAAFRCISRCEGGSDERKNRVGSRRWGVALRVGIQGRHFRSREDSFPDLAITLCSCPESARPVRHRYSRQLPEPFVLGSRSENAHPAVSCFVTNHQQPRSFLWSAVHNTSMERRNTVHIKSTSSRAAGRISIIHCIECSKRPKLCNWISQ